MNLQILPPLKRNTRSPEGKFIQTTEKPWPDDTVNNLGLKSRAVFTCLSSISLAFV